MEAKLEKTSEGPLHPMQYKVRSGTTDSGKEYEKKMLTLFALRCALRDEEDIWIASNAPNVGAFDDVVLHYGNITFLVQLKHKENAKPVVKEAFKEEKGDFSFTKYYKDIANLKKSLDSDNNKPEFVRYLNAFDKLYFILFTNRGVNDCDFLEESNEQLLQFLNTSDKGKILKTVTHKFSSIVNQNNVDSCKDIYLFSNQMSVKHTDHQIQEEIRNIICKFDLAPTNVKTVADHFTKYVSDWAEGKLGSYYCLSKTEILRKLSEIFLGQYQLNLSKQMFDIGVHTQIAIWKQLMNSNALTFVNYDQSVIQFLIKYISKEVFKYCGESISSWLSHLSTSAQSAFYEIHKTLKSHMLKLVRNRSKITGEDIYKCLWLAGELPVLLVIKNKEHYSDILKILKLCAYCYKVIIINKSEEQILPQRGEDQIKQCFSLEDLSENDRNNILKLSVTLQGRSSATLQDLVDQNLFHLVNCNDIINILLDNFSIGNNLEPLPDYFIERKVSKVLLKSEVIEKVKDEKFVIDGSEKCTKSQIVQNSYTSKWEDFDIADAKKRKVFRSDFLFDSVQEQKENSDPFTRQIVHHLSVYDENHFEWKSSDGSITNIRKFAVLSKPAFENNVLNTLSSKITLFSGPPGMGKSVLMNFIARNIPSSKWVLKIDLNSYMEFCKMHKVNILTITPSEQVKNLCDFSGDERGSTKLAHSVFEKLKLSKNVIILLDGFDEVSVLHKKEVTAMIQSLYKEGFHICLTTRPHMESHLEDEFNTFSISLKPFSQEDQQQFLTNYFTSRNKDIHFNLSRYVTEFTERLLNATRNNLSDMDATFTEIPLQCALLAEVFNEDCREFILSKGTFIFNENFDLLYLYRNFITSKMDILRHKFGCSSEETSILLLNNLQSLFALKLLFPFHKDIITHVETLSDYRYKNKSEEVILLQKGGIVTVDKNFNVSFSHRTFGEYIAAKWLAENFNSSDQKLRDYVKLLISERFSQNYKFLFIMFDRIVAEKCPLHLEILNGDTNNIIEAINSHPDSVLMTDKCKRTLLHLIALYGIQYPSLYENFSQTKEAQNFLNIETYKKDSMLNLFEILSEKNTKFELDALGYSPLDYALANCSLTIANKLCTKLKLTRINAIINLNRKQNYLGYCALQDYEELFEILLIYFATKDFFMNQVRRKKSVKSYFHDMFVNYDQKTKITDYGSKLIDKSISELISTEGLKVFPVLNNRDTNVHIHTIFGATENVRCLVNQGVDVNQRDSDYHTPLHYAVLHKNRDILDILLLNGANVSEFNFQKSTPLHLAVIAHDYSKQHKKFVDSLKTHFRFTFFNVDEIVNKLITQKANLNLQDSDGNTPLHLALLHKNEHLAQLLLSKNSDAKLENEKGQTALHLAATLGYNSIVCKLLPAVDINKQDKIGDTPLHCALSNNKLDTVKLLIPQSVNVNSQGKFGWNCLHLTCYYGHTNIASEILPKIKDINQQDNDGNTSLHLAVQQNKLDLVRFLISKGADANIPNKFGDNCLHTASYKGHIDIASEILPKIKDINQQDIDGFTSLQLAVHKNKLDLVRFLISKGADANISNNSGRNRLHTASYKGHIDIASEILPKIKDINQQDNDGNTSLHLAVQQNKLDLVRFLIFKGADANIPNKFGENCLHTASYKGHIDIASEILPKIKDIHQQKNDGFTSIQMAVQENKRDLVRFLISKGADANIPNKFGENCLHTASYKGHIDIASEILPKIKDINQQDIDGFTSLQLAVHKNKLDLVRFLISKGADANISNNSGKNCLHTASYKGHIDIASEILPKIKDINQQKKDGFTSLQLAVHKNKLDLVRFLISKGADANISNNSGRNCLHTASYKGHIDIASEILPKIKDINQQKKDGFTSLQLAVHKNKLDLVRFLISKGADANISNNSGRNCLHTASYKGHIDIASEILPKIKDINQQDNDGNTSLHLAVQQNKLDLVRFLIFKGADANIPNKFGENCLHTASYNGHIDIASEILPKIKDINQQNNKGFTSLHFAVRENKLDLVKFLISKGADANISNKYGHNCLHVASCKGHIDIAAELLSKIKDINQQDNEGDTSLQCAVQENKLELVRFLISKDADASIPNKLGRNCLHDASYKGHIDIASEILTKIKNINQQDNFDFTSFDYAVDQNKINMVKLLISAGANIKVEEKYDWNYIDLADFFI